jgi:hypothetical protein|tara:strand:- start:4915 stop:5241 length:327 start_codon:yes stop_codon:yes gene_type:complete
MEDNMQDGSNFNLISELADEDVNRLVKAQESYGDSWRSRGGVGAFMMLARKWDRIENQVTKEGYDIFKTINNDPSSTGILDDIRDLRRYLLLVEGYVTDNWRKEYNND